MSLKFKALGLGFLAALAMSTVSVMSASATSTGHFTSDSPNGKTTFLGSDAGSHQTEFTLHGFSGGFDCDLFSYNGTDSGNTLTSITVTPDYTKCFTTGESPDSSVVTLNGCSYTFTPGGSGTVHVDCPAGKAIEIHHPNCVITMRPQTAQGITYTNVIDFNGKHFLTLDANTTQFNTEFHGGVCIFTGTNHTATLHGSTTIRGFRDEGAGQPLGPQVNITHTAE